MYMLMSSFATLMQYAQLHEYTLFIEFHYDIFIYLVKTNNKHLLNLI
jgi:hypothetical protein